MVLALGNLLYLAAESEFCPMNEKVMVVILTLSLLANLGMGLFIAIEQFSGPGIAHEEYEAGVHAIQTTEPPGDSARTLPVRDVLDPLSGKTKRSASLQGLAVITTINYTREGRYIYQQMNETGTTINVTVDIIPGGGRILVQTTPLMGILFQDAANTAVAVAKNRTAADLSGSDVIFSITSDGVISTVDGASAGALMTIITHAAATGEPLWENRTLTGTINPDGSIGAVGGVIEKARAAKEAGKDLLLLPRENANIVIRNESSMNMGGFRMTRLVSETVSAKEYIESRIGIRVEFVDTIDEVERYLIRTGHPG